MSGLWRPKEGMALKIACEEQHSTYYTILYILHKLFVLVLWGIWPLMNVIYFAILLCKPLYNAFDSLHTKCNLTFKGAIIVSYSASAKLSDKAIKWRTDLHKK